MSRIFVLLVLITLKTFLFGQVEPNPTKNYKDSLCSQKSISNGYCFCDDLIEKQDSVWCWTKKGFKQPILRFYINGTRREQIHYYDSLFTIKKEYLILNDKNQLVGKWYWNESGKLIGYFYHKEGRYYWKGKLGNSKRRCKGSGSIERFHRKYPPRP